MRHSFVGALLVAGLVVAATAGRTSSQPVPTSIPTESQSGDLITHVTAGDGQPQVVTVIEPRKRVMAVYQVDRGTGQITLKSVRNFTWDLQMIEFNSGEPLPQDIRSGLQR
jgi:hypothetical protein